MQKGLKLQGTWWPVIPPLYRDATLWNFLGAMWAPELKILGAQKKIYEPTMKQDL